MTAEREVLDYLQDIAEMMTHIQEFTDGMNFDAFIKDLKTNFAVFRALEVIGEAAKQVPEDVRERYPHIPWRRMAGMRDRLIHGYFGVDFDIVWETASRLIPELAPQISAVVRMESEH
jgi:uncharacterized protein with HEPN domain